MFWGLGALGLFFRVLCGQSMTALPDLTLNGGAPRRSFHGLRCLELLFQVAREGLVRGSGRDFSKTDDSGARFLSLRIQV